MKEIFFVRHGETEWNAVARMQGQLDSALSALGREQAEAHGRFLAGRDLQAIFASPLGRARETAGFIRRHVPLPVTYDDRLKEWDCGAWSGHLYADVQVRWREAWNAREADPFHYRGPECENFPDMIERVSPFLAKMDAHPASRMAIVSHGLIGRVMISQVLGLDEAATLSFHQPNDKVFHVTRTSEGSSVQHFVGGKGPWPGLG